MSNFISILIFGAISLGISGALLVWLIRSGCTFVKFRMESLVGKFELLASKSPDDLIASHNRLVPSKEANDQGIEN